MFNRRSPASKSRGAARFRRDSSRTHRKNMKAQPRRGGWRL